MADDERSRRGRKVLGGGLTLAALGGLVAAAVLRSRAATTIWSSGEDPCGPDGLGLPEGEALTVTTDDGAELAVVVAGPSGARTVVMAHCWTGVKEFWGPVARRLVAAGHRVVVYDQRGHGRSTMGSGPTSMDRLGDDLLAVLDAVGTTDVVLAGHSMGGMTVQALAVNHPDVVRDRVHGVALVATSARVVPRPLPAFAVDRFLGDAATRRLLQRGRAATRGVLGTEVFESHLDATFDAFVATSGAARSGFFTGMTRMDYRAGLASVGVPTTIVVGSRDRLTPVRWSRVLAASIPGAELIVLPGFGHMLPLEAPAEVADAIAALAD